MPFPEPLNQIDAFPQSPFSKEYLYFPDPNPDFDPILIVSPILREENKMELYDMGPSLSDGDESRASKAKLKAIEKSELYKKSKEKNAKEIRAEKNRKYATDSRDRKKRYVENLEEEGKRLKYELDIYKQN